MKFSKLLQGCILSAGVIVTAMAAASTDTVQNTEVQETNLVGEKGTDAADSLAMLSDIVSYKKAKQTVSGEKEKEEPADVQANETIEVMAAGGDVAEDASTADAETVEPVGVGANQVAAQIGAEASQPAAETADAAEAEQPTTDAAEAEQPVAETTETKQPAADAAEAEQPALDASAAAVNETPANEWVNQVMPVVEESLNVRTQPDENAELAGKLYKGSAAQVVEVLDGWTHIVSGDVDGYISNEYCAYGADAQALAAEQCATYATALTDGLRVRDEATLESSISTVLEEGARIEVDTQTAAPEGWVAVTHEDELCYVSAEFVDVKMEIGEAITIEEEMRRIAEEEARKAEEAARKAAEEAAAASSAQTVQNEAVAASADETTLLAAIIQIEAGTTDYDGQVAVGAVVMNRVRSGAYPGTIAGVIYQSGQFATGRMDSIIANGVASSCYSAAQAAIGGVDNTGGALSFRSASSGYAGTVIGGNVFF